MHVARVQICRRLALPGARVSWPHEDDAYLDASCRALSRVEEFAPELLLVSLGLDAHKDDPSGGFALTTPAFARIGKAIADAGYPTVLIQEGGYDVELLGTNLIAALGAFCSVSS